MDDWEAKVEACPLGEVVPETPVEVDFVNRLRKKKWGYVATIKRRMRITDDNCIFLNA